MGRPAKSVKVKSGAIAAGEEQARREVEDKLRGQRVKLRPPDYMSQDQKKIFRFIVSQLEDSEILGRLDVFVLEATAVAIVRLRRINELIDTNDRYLSDTALQNSRAKYQSDLWRGCSELCMSPQARAKIGNILAQAAKEKKDPLLAALEDDD